MLERGRGNPIEACSVIVIVLGIGHTPNAPLLLQAMVDTFERHRVEVDKSMSMFGIPRVTSW